VQIGLRAPLAKSSSAFGSDDGHHRAALDWRTRISQLGAASLCHVSDWPRGLQAVFHFPASPTHSLARMASYLRNPVSNEEERNVRVTFQSASISSRLKLTGRQAMDFDTASERERSRQLARRGRS
jgi:hypothetical protein